MGGETGVKGQLEIAQGRLEKLAAAVSGKPSVLDNMEKVSDLASETKLKIQQLDPIDDYVEIQRLKIIADRQKKLKDDITKYTLEFKELQKRMIYRQSVSVFTKLSALLSGPATGIPSLEELQSFIEKVNKAAQSDYGDDCDAEGEYSELISHVKTLSYALGVAIKLKILEEKLTEAPLSDLEDRERELFDLKKRMPACRGWFSDLGMLDHPLNINSWNDVATGIERDLKILQRISDKTHQFRQAVGIATVEAELPSIAEIQQVEQEIDQQFGSIKSARHAPLRVILVGIKDSIQQIKSAKIEKVKQEFNEIDRQFELWRSTILQIQTDFIQNGGKAFPWRFLPPSKKEINALLAKVEQKKQQYSEWPCVQAVLPKKQYHLEHYQKLLVTMKDLTEEKINDAFKEPNFSIKKIQQHIKIYKTLLIKGGYDNADELLANMELRLFKFAHQQSKKSQWLSFFRRSYFDNFANFSWLEIAANVSGKNFGYSGFRTTEVLKTLGWLKNESLTELAPRSLIENLNELKASETQAELAQNITF